MLTFEQKLKAGRKPATAMTALTGRVHLGQGGEVRSILRPKLAVGAQVDAYEREADHIADRVMRMADPRESGAAGPSEIPAFRQGRKNPERLRAELAGSSGAQETPVPSAVRDILRSPGQPLPRTTRSFMEERFNHDFTRVRLHSDANAAALATALHARAFTVGNHIVFSHGMPAADTHSGRQVLAHELTHVIQQSKGPPAIARLSASDCSSDCAREDGKDEATGKFSITVYADKDGPFLLLPATQKVGHAWLRLENDQGKYWTYGFWPQEGYYASNPTADVDGCVHHPDTSHEPTSSQRFELTAAQFAKALITARRYCLNKPKYNLFGLQCTEFVKRILDAAGEGSFGGFGLIWESPNALDTWIRTHSLVLGTSVTAATSAPGGAGAGSVGAELIYRHQFYSLLGEKLRLYGLGRAEISAPVKSLTAGAGLELNPQKIWIPAPYVEGGAILGDLGPLPDETRFGTGATGAAGLRFNIDELALVGVEYNVVKDIVGNDPVLHRFMVTAGIRLF
ncbi:MAG: DUF4157 domain-containing protein [Desulfobacterales bacterium]